MEEEKNLVGMEQQQRNSRRTMAQHFDKDTSQQEEDDFFIEAARYLDKGQDVPEELYSQLNQENSGEEQSEPESGESSKEGGEKPAEVPEEKKPDESGEEKKGETSSETSAPDPGQEKLSKYERKREEKKKKDAKRQELTWKKLQETREEVYAEKERLLKEREEFLKERNAPRSSKFTSEAYYEAYIDFTKRAEKALANCTESLDPDDLALANDNFLKAQEAFKESQKVYQEEVLMRQRDEAEKRNREWGQSVERQMGIDKELLDPESPLGREVLAIINSPVNPADRSSASMIEVFKMLPNGFETVVQIARWKLGDERREELEKALKEKTAENERLTKLTSISSSGRAVQSGEHEFDNLNETDQEEYLMKAAREYDRQIRFK